MPNTSSIRSSVSIEHRLVTDRHRHRPMASTAGAQHRAVKTIIETSMLEVQPTGQRSRMATGSGHIISGGGISSRGCGGRHVVCNGQEGILYHTLHSLALLIDYVGDSVQNLNFLHLQLMILLLFLFSDQQLRCFNAFIFLPLTHV